MTSAAAASAASKASTKKDAVARSDDLSFLDQGRSFDQGREFAAEARGAEEDQAEQDQELELEEEQRQALLAARRAEQRRQALRHRRAALAQRQAALERQRAALQAGMESDDDGYMAVAQAALGEAGDGASVGEGASAMAPPAPNGRLSDRAIRAIVNARVHEARVQHTVMKQFMKEFSRNLKLSVLEDSKGDMPESERLAAIAALKQGKELPAFKPDAKPKAEAAAHGHHHPHHGHHHHQHVQMLNAGHRHHQASPAAASPEEIAPAGDAMPPQPLQFREEAASDTSAAARGPFDEIMRPRAFHPSHRRVPREAPWRPLESQPTSAMMEEQSEVLPPPLMAADRVADGVQGEPPSPGMTLLRPSHADLDMEQQRELALMAAGGEDLPFAHPRKRSFQRLLNQPRHSHHGPPLLFGDVSEQKPARGMRPQQNGSARPPLFGVAVALGAALLWPLGTR